MKYVVVVIILVVCDIGEFLATGTISNSSDAHIWNRDFGSATVSNDFFPSQKKNDNLSQDSTTTSSEANISPSESWRKGASVTRLACDFGGRRLRVAASPQPPLVNCLQDLYGDWICNGSNVEVIKLLASQLNFEPEWVVLANKLPDQQTGDFQQHRKLVSGRNNSRTGNYTGLVGLVTSGRAAMAANGFMATAERLRNRLLLSRPFDSFKLHFLLSKSVRDHDHIFLKPFNSSAWTAILLSALFMWLAFYLTNTTTLYYLLQDDHFLARRVPLLKCLQYYLSRLLFVSGRRRSLVGRLLLFLRDHIGASSGGKRRSSSGSEGLRNFEEEVERMVSSGGMLPFGSQQTALKLEERRRFRQACKRWLWERKRARRLSRLQHATGFFRLPYVLWYVLGSLANQGGETEELPRASSTRILVAFWWLYLIVICSIHSGILTAILTFPKQLDFIQTLDDYLELEEHERMEMKLTVDRGSEAGNLLLSPDNLHKSPLQQLLVQSAEEQYEFKQPIVEVDFRRHRERILHEVRAGKVAFLEEKAALELVITQEFYEQKPAKCELKTSRFPVDTIPMSLILNGELLGAGGDCLPAVDSLLRRVMQTGLAQKWRRSFEAQGNDCLNTVIINAGDVDKIHLRQVVLGFWLLGSGLLAGGLCLVVEVIWLFAIEEEEEGEHCRRDEDFYGDFQRFRSSSLSSESSSSSSSASDLSSSSGIFSVRSRAGSGSNESDQLRLGHRAPFVKKRTIKSLAGRELSLRKTLKRHRRAQGSSFLAMKLQVLPPSSPSQFGTRLKQAQTYEGELEPLDLDELSQALRAERRRRRAARLAERRARRVRRTLELVRRIHEGKVYSNSKSILSRAANSVQNRARRASRAIAGHFGTQPSSIELARRDRIILGDTRARSSFENVRRRRLTRVGIAEEISMIN